MRWFVACELQEAARHAIAEHVSALKARLGERERAVRWVEAEKWHVTLAFLGTVAPAVATDVRSACAERVPHAPFSVDLGELGVFPSLARPRVIWVGVAAGTDRLRALQRLVVLRLAQAGWVAVERQTFSPHVTVGRLRFASGASTLIADSVRLRAPVPGRTLVEHVTLFDSRVVDGRAVYDVVARAPLWLTPSSS